MCIRDRDPHLDTNPELHYQQKDEYSRLSDVYKRQGIVRTGNIFVDRHIIISVARGERKRLVAASVQIIGIDLSLIHI